MRDEAFDTHGLLYQLGTSWGAQPYANPADAGRVTVRPLSALSRPPRFSARASPAPRLDLAVTSVSGALVQGRGQLLLDRRRTQGGRRGAGARSRRNLALPLRSRPDLALTSPRFNPRTQAARVICAHRHPGANATQWSKGAPKASLLH